MQDSVGCFISPVQHQKLLDQAIKFLHEKHGDTLKALAELESHEDWGKHTSDERPGF